MTTDDLIRTLQRDRRFRGHVAHVEVLPGREGEYGTLDLPAELQAYLDRRGIRLYSHQCQAIRLIRQGASIVITTPTASGKTLAFSLPILERFATDPQATALYLYPTKALANDQLKAIQELEKFSGIPVGAAVYDGDTPAARRPRIREIARIVISNPYELHQILPWHHKWSRFLSNLQYVVVDEAHRYRGVFGSNIALLIRRLRRICRFYGSNPQFVLSTATLANAVEFAGRLTGLRFSPVSGDGAPRGRKRFILYNPCSDGGGGRSTHLHTRDLLLACMHAGLQTLCFSTSRRMAELIARWTRDELPRDRSGWVTAYRAGYLPAERREIENRLKTGQLRGVVATNALELGIDIGSLDAVIISGYPGTMMSVWQQAGRGGRRQDDSIAMLVAFENPLDQYFMRHPASFFGRPHEHAIVDDKNPHIVAGHLLCAASELPLRPERDAEFFPGCGEETLAALEGCGLLRKTPRGWVYAGRGRAVDAVKLDSVSADTFRVSCDGRLLETLGTAQAFREAHPGAILLHQGDSYIVREFDREGRNIQVRETDADYYTRPMKSVDLVILREERREDLDGTSLSFGFVEVTEQYTGYKIMRHDEVVGMEPLDLPPLRFETAAVWFTVPAERGLELAAAGMDFAGGLHGIEHALIGMLPFHVMCDRRDIGGVSTTFHPGTGQPTVFVYDGVEGGIGLAEKAYEILGEIARMSAELVRDCRCERGCPSCIYSPKCGNDNQPLDKPATVRLLEGLTVSLEGRSAGT
ncbi:MAG: DEAD/DEAH box helicase [Methanomicrobiales archaeon]|nr:DEAD/DEAH box helicase [Methanomicrobiales archaeon]